MNELNDKTNENIDLKSIFLNGIIKENPVLVLLLGTCPTLAVTTSAINGLGMGISTMIVLIFSNIFISVFKNVIPSRVRIPAYIVIIAGFVTIVGFIVKAYAPGIDKALGIFLPLIVVNCIILGRAEMFASRKGVFESTFDGLGMGTGFTLALLMIGASRELLGSGMLFGVSITSNIIEPMGIFLMPPGGFFIFGCMIALVNKIMKERKISAKQEMGCAGCPSSGTCNMVSDKEYLGNNKLKGDK
jgi:electron transport complex protein RnfE